MTAYEAMIHKLMEKQGITPNMIGDTVRLSDVDVLNRQQGSLIGYNCNLCRNKGVIYTADKDGYVLAQRCKCMTVRDAHARLARSGLQKAIERCRFDNFTTDKPFQKAMLRQATRYAYGDGIGFFIGGQSGCGKTHICTAIVGVMITERHKAARYMQWREDATHIKQYANLPEYGSIVSPLKHCDVLYIDDLFKGSNPTPADINLSFELINYRYNAGLPTIISSEYTLDRLLKIDQATASRIKEMSGNYWMNINPDESKNYRLR